MLRVRSNGDIPRDNPFYGQGGNARYVFSYGHRNLQGLAVRPGTDELWSAEHGPDRDDEVNLISRGANYGWSPKGPGYDECVPMTDLDQVPDGHARPSGAPARPPSRPADWPFCRLGLGTLAGCPRGGAAQGPGDQAAVPRPADQGAHRYVLDREVSPYGRIRTVQYGPDRALYFTSSNGNGDDVVGKLSVSVTSPRLTEGTDISPVAPSGVRTDGDLYAFIRTDGQPGRVQAQHQRRRHAGRPAWTDTRLTSTSAPSVASSATGSGGHRDSQREPVDHPHLAGRRRHARARPTSAGSRANATVSSLGNGTLDVFALRTDGKAFRKRYNGTNWSGWQELSGPRFTSRLGASAQPSTGSTLSPPAGPAGWSTSAT